METTFPRLLLRHAAQRPADAAMREKEYGIWQTLSWGDLAGLVRHLACGLHLAGLRRGEHMVVVGANRPRLYATMLAAQSLGAIPVPLYQDAVAAECAFPINNADVRFAFAEDQEQVDKLLEVRTQCPQLAAIFFDNPRGLRHYREPGLQALDTLIEAGRTFDAKNPDAFRAEVDKGHPDDVGAMFFTSGTTGSPKGVVHTHRTLLDRAKAGADFDKLGPREEVLAYLPPAWIGQNIFSYAQWLCCGYVVNCPESAATVTIDLKEIGPTYYFAPPRIFEGLLTSVMIRMEDASAIKRWMFHGFMNVARRVGLAMRAGKPVGVLDRLQYGLGNLLVYGPLRNNLGMSRVRVAYTAGEAIGPDLFAFYRAIGINLKQLYGSTETAVFVCMQPDHQVHSDTVGVPIDGVEIEVSDTGEILVRSPGLLKEYYKNPAATAEVRTSDGWYRTGDAGFFDAQGHLKIIDRAKDVGRLADGSMFAPKYIENKLKFFPYIKEAVAFGDGRDMVGAFINIDIEAVGNWAERRNLPYAGYADLATKPAVIELVRICIEKANEELAAEGYMGACQIHRFIVLHKELDSDDGEMTLSKKVRREFVFGKYAPLIEAVYEGRESQFFETDAKLRDGRISKTSAVLPICPARTFPLLALAA